MIPPLLRRLALALLLSLALVAGAAADPFEVATYADLCKVGTGVDGWTLDAEYIQTADIQCPAGTAFPMVGATPLDAFTGTYDGGDYVIRDLTITVTRDFCREGMIRYLGNTGTVQNVRLENVTVTATSSSYIGALVGYSEGTITGCHVTGTLSGGEYASGLLVGYSVGNLTGCSAYGDVAANDHAAVVVGVASGTITGCTATGTVESGHLSGGLMGTTLDEDSLQISDCAANVTVMCDSMAGGLIGKSSLNTVITNSTATGDVGVSDGYALGGLVGYFSPAYGSGNALTLTNCHASGAIVGDGHLGGLLGNQAGPAYITNCSATGTVRGTDYYIGGLIGYFTSGEVEDCFAAGDVVGQGLTGGLIGSAGTGTVTRCYATGDVTANVTEDDIHTGGLIGRNDEVQIDQCVARGNVSGVQFVGGLVGTHYGGSITDSYATGSVSASSEWPAFAGGLIGYWSGGAISTSYSVGEVSSPNSATPPDAPTLSGGFAGDDSSGTYIATACFWDTESSGWVTTHGGATGKTTAEMQALATFADWSIATPAAYTDEVWYLVPGEDYPRLAWEGLPPLPPVAAFSASPTTGTAPLTVQFTDTSTGTPTSWHWDFGDSTTSTLQNPSHTYTTPGTYTVTLTATNAGGSDTKTKTGHITVTAPILPPVAGFWASPTTGTAPLTVQFTDASTGSPTARSWSFGDGRTSIAQSPSHTYSTAGTYTVALTVTNAGGSDTEIKNGYITVSAAPPTAPPTAAGSPAFPYSQQRKETLSFLLMCWGGLAFVGVFCVVIFLLMNGAQRGSGGI